RTVSPRRVGRRQVSNLAALILSLALLACIPRAVAPPRLESPQPNGPAAPQPPQPVSPLFPSPVAREAGAGASPRLLLPIAGAAAAEAPALALPGPGGLPTPGRR